MHLRIKTNNKINSSDMITARKVIIIYLKTSHKSCSRRMLVILLMCKVIYTILFLSIIITIRLNRKKERCCNNTSVRPSVCPTGAETRKH